MNDMEYNFCTRCGAKVAKGSFFCTSCGHKLRTEDITAVDGIYEKVKDKKGISKGEKAAVSIAILLPLVMAIIAFCIIYVPQAKVKNTYADLKEAMNIGDKGIYKVEELLKKLPDDYKDVKKIRYEYEEIAANITILSNADLTRDNARLARDIFKSFEVLEWKNSDWEITDYLTKRYAALLIFSQRWRSGGDEFLWYTYSKDEYDTIITTLPGKMNEMDPSTYYYEYTDQGLIIGYADPQTGEKVKQYEVLDVSYYGDWNIKMYCYANDTVYNFWPYF